MTRHPLRRLAVCALTAAVAVLPAGPALAGGGTLPAVHPRAETPPLRDDEAGGNADADDPAIWRNPADPDRSLVVATAKEGGLRVYDLAARLVQSVVAPPGPGADDAPGRFNNVDLVHGVKLSTGRADLAVTTDRGNDRLRVYRIDPCAAGPPADRRHRPGRRPGLLGRPGRDQRAAHRVRAGHLHPPDHRPLLRPGQPAPAHPDRAARTDPHRAGPRRLPHGPHPGPALRLPAARRHLLVALRGAGRGAAGRGHGRRPGQRGAVRRSGGRRHLESRARRPHRHAELLDKVREYGVPGTYDESTEECVAGADPGYGGTRLTAGDVEGLTLVQQKDGDGYLLASSQGDDTFAAYDRETGEANEYEGGFRVTAASAALDGSEECDGAAALNQPLGSRYPHGLLVVQDGHDAPGDGDTGVTNFKYVDLGDVLDALDD
ncbi:Hydrolase OS=Streptomyces fumanus OX=67302 GN=GCM10018772_27120 PE=4 SV=1 [Streptomyces fumanus]